jgi:hypothetical protein
MVRRYGVVPEQWLADGGFAKLEQIEAVAARGSTPYLPVMAARPSETRKRRERVTALPSPNGASAWPATKRATSTSSAAPGRVRQRAVA